MATTTLLYANDYLAVASKPFAWTFPKDSATEWNGKIVPDVLAWLFARYLDSPAMHAASLVCREWANAAHDPYTVGHWTKSYVCANVSADSYSARDWSTVPVKLTDEGKKAHAKAYAVWAAWLVSGTTPLAVVWREMKHLAGPAFVPYVSGRTMVILALNKTAQYPRVHPNAHRYSANPWYTTNVVAPFMCYVTFLRTPFTIFPRSLLVKMIDNFQGGRELAILLGTTVQRYHGVVGYEGLRDHLRDSGVMRDIHEGFPNLVGLYASVKKCAMEFAGHNVTSTGLFAKDWWSTPNAWRVAHYTIITRLLADGCPCMREILYPGHTKESLTEMAEQLTVLCGKMND